MKATGLCSQGPGLLRKTLPALPNWHRMSGPGRLPPPPRTVPIETGPPAKTLGPRSDPGPGAAGRPLAKFEPGSSRALLLEVSWPPLRKGELSLQRRPDTGPSPGNCRLSSSSPGPFQPRKAGLQRLEKRLLVGLWSPSQLSWLQVPHPQVPRPPRAAPAQRHSGKATRSPLAYLPGAVLPSFFRTKKMCVFME